MKIAIYHNLPSGGAKRALYEWIRRLAPSHVIDVYTLSTADHDFCDLRPIVQGYRVFEFAPHEQFLPPLGRLNRLQRWRDLGDLARISRGIAEQINSQDYDVLFAHPCAYTFIPILVRFLQVPVVYYLHEPFGPSTERTIQRPYLKETSRWRNISKQLDPLYILYTHRLETDRVESMRRTTRLLANSWFTQQQMKLAYGVDAPVCRYGVNSEAFHPMSNLEKESWLLSVGELTPRKGFDFLIESLAQISHDSRPGLKLACNIANAEERAYIEELAERRGVQLHIQIGLSSDELVVEYNRARLCVYAPVLEPLGLVPLESMACGTPVVGVAEAGVCETIRHGETGLLTEREPNQFAAAIVRLLDNPQLAEEFGKQGVNYVRAHWNWDASVAKLESHLSAVVQEDPDKKVSLTPVRRRDVDFVSGAGDMGSGEQASQPSTMVCPASEECSSRHDAQTVIEET